MLCPSCGAEHSPKQCQQLSPVAARVAALVTPEFESDSLDLEEIDMSESPTEAKPASRLIEFPGVTRRAVPQWRKELSERVREVQERKAREAALELAITREEVDPTRDVPPTATAPQLELLPQVETPEINPVLAAALRRIERAHETTATNNYASTGTAVAVAREQEVEAVWQTEPLPASEVLTEPEPAPSSERTHSLVVVQQPAVSDLEIALQDQPGDTEPEPALTPKPLPVTEKPRPRRLIADDLNDPALSYLDAIGLRSGPVRVEDRASLSVRFVAGFIDAIAVGFLSLPFAALIELQNGNWLQPRIIALMGGIGAIVMFIYATVCTALTGKTLGMRLLSLRAVDARNGLIPTGSQSAGRALVYLLSLATLGCGLLMAFARGEGKTAHDRLTRTAVVRD